jgi:hypothetical protein
MLILPHPAPVSVGWGGAQGEDIMADAHVLEQGIVALKAGRKAQARALLARAVRQNPRDERAWLWLSGAVETEAERRTCLERVLALDPDNEAARRGLDSLAGATALAPQPQTQAVPAPDPTGEGSSGVAQAEGAVGEPFLMLGLGLAAVAILILLAYGVVQWAGGQEAPALEPLYDVPYVVVYGRKSCGLTTGMLEGLEAREVPYIFKSIDDRAVQEEVYPRMKAAGLNTRRFMLPVVDVSGRMLLDARAPAVAERYRQTAQEGQDGG